MNEWFKKTFGTIKEKWGKWTIVQKVILIGIIVLVIAAVIVLFAVSGNKAAVRLFNSPVDASQRHQIVNRLQKDGIKADVDSEGYITVDMKGLREVKGRLLCAKPMLHNSMKAKMKTFFLMIGKWFFSFVVLSFIIVLG